MQDKKLSESALENVGGGAAMVDIVPEGSNTRRCFNCKSTNLVVESSGSVNTITCRDCGAVDFEKH